MSKKNLSRHDRIRRFVARLIRYCIFRITKAPPQLLNSAEELLREDETALSVLDEYELELLKHEAIKRAIYTLGIYDMTCLNCQNYINCLEVCFDRLEDYYGTIHTEEDDIRNCNDCVSGECELREYFSSSMALFQCPYGAVREIYDYQYMAVRDAFDYLRRNYGINITEEDVWRSTGKRG